VSVRWVRDGLKLVRVDGPPPARETPAADPAPKDDDYRVRLRAFADPYRALARRAGLGVAPVTPEQVRRARHLAGVGQWQLAQTLGLARSTIAGAETRRRGIPPALADWVRGVLASDARESSR
jgi:hypothetical protein